MKYKHSPTYFTFKDTVRCQNKPKTLINTFNNLWGKHFSYLSFSPSLTHTTVGRNLVVSDHTFRRRIPDSASQIKQDNNFRSKHLVNSFGLLSVYD